VSKDGRNKVALPGALDGNGQRGDHYVVMRAMTGRDLIAMSGSDEDLGALLTQLGKAVIEHDFVTVNDEGETVPADVLDQPWETLQLMLKGWRARSEEEALPQA